jgi:membrane-associated phospholipid phosphatase
MSSQTRVFWTRVGAAAAAATSLILLASPCEARAPPASGPTANAPSNSGARPAPRRTIPLAEAAPEHWLHWNYPRFRPWQYVAVGAQTAANLTIEFTDFPSRGETWRKPLPLDVEARKFFVAPSYESKERAASVSDVMWWTTQFYTVVVDSLVIPLAFDDMNTDVAFQMTMINWQTLGLTGIVTRIAHHSSGRARPSTHGCSDQAGASFPCRPNGPGFFAGHVAMTSAGAALACAHHAALPLYGDGPGGTITCVLLSASAVGVGVLRMVADRHWISDVIVGHLAGGAIGFGLPWLLHYQEPLAPDLSALGVRHAAWLPWASSESASLSLIGEF